MSALTRDVTAGIIDAFDFSPFSRVVDVGGEHGTLLGGVFAANPGLFGVVFDQPHVVGGTAATWERLGVAGRCTAEGGDFFARVPSGDLIMLKAILHDGEPGSASSARCRHAPECLRSKQRRDPASARHRFCSDRMTIAFQHTAKRALQATRNMIESRFDCLKITRRVAIRHQPKALSLRGGSWRRLSERTASVFNLVCGFALKHRTIIEDQYFQQ